MNIKDALLKLKSNLLIQQSKEDNDQEEEKSMNLNSAMDGNEELKQEDVLYRREIDLTLKIEEFLNWYLENMVNPCTIEMEYRMKESEEKYLNNFIEKMAVWYELRYPNYELDRLFDDGNVYHKDISKIMLQDNEAIQDIILSLNFSHLKWADFYNAKCFIISLSKYEKEYIERPKYPQMIWLEPYTVGESNYLNSSTIIYPSANGKIMRIDRDFDFRKDKKKIIGMSLKEFSSYLKERGDINFVKGKDGLEEYILQYENKKYSKEGILDCVMYRILERGSNFYGPCRAYLFAKEFKRDQELPIKYAMDKCDYLNKLLNAYLDNGGNFDLECYVNYFNKHNDEKITMMSIREYFKENEFHTSEETALYQRLVNSFSTYQERIIPTEEEVIVQKRLERKLNKVKQSK